MKFILPDGTEVDTDGAIEKDGKIAYRHEGKEGRRYFMLDAQADPPVRPISAREALHWTLV